MNTRRLAGFLLTLSAIASLPACAQTAMTPSLTPVTVQLGWTHQAQFAGFYAADQNGDYCAAEASTAFSRADQMNVPRTTLWALSIMNYP